MATHHGKDDGKQPSEFKVKKHSAAKAKATGYEGAYVPANTAKLVKESRKVSGTSLTASPSGY